MSSRHGSIESLTLAGEAGGLEALLNLGSPDAKYAALVCHPHPLFGGTMHNKVVFAAAKALNGAGFPVLRFNFRGVGLSQGEHDEGRGEIADVRVGLDYLAERFKVPILFAGYSFGSAVGLRAAAEHPQVVGLILIGAPVNAGGREYTYELLETSSKPKLLISGDHDEFAPLPQLQEIYARAVEPKRLVVLAGANHFFGGHLDGLREAVTSWADQIANASGAAAV